MGSPAFAVPALQALVGAGHQIAAVYCQPPKPAGRGQRLTKCAVHQAAEGLGLSVRVPVRLQLNPNEAAYLRALELDAAVVVAYGLILPPAILAVPRLGCVNIHASLLPRWRGAAPIQAAILAGDAKTGVTIMQMDAGLDTGPALLSESVIIADADTAASLHDRLSIIGARLIVTTLDDDWTPQVQFGEPFYAPKLSRADAMIDWTETATVIERRIRAFTPWPGTETRWAGQTLKIVTAEVVDRQGEPGVVLDERMTIACGRNALRLITVKRGGGVTMDVASFLRGHPVSAGTRLG